MIVCDTCGCPVDSDSLQLHSDWHDDLVTRSDLAKNKLANPNRTQFNPDPNIQDC